MAIDTYAISTLAALKAYMGISVVTNDTVLETCIDRATHAVETYLDRIVVERRLYEWTTARGDGSLVLRASPISHVHFVGFGSAPCLQIDATVGTDITNTVSVDESKLVLTRMQSDGTETQTVIAFSTAKTSTLLAATINGTTGFSATVAKNCGSRRINRVVGRDIRNAPAQLTFTDNAQTDVTGDLPRGILHLAGSGYDDDCDRGYWPHGELSVFVDYDGGWAIVPYDIVQAFLMIAARMFNERQRDTGLASESFGDYSATVTAPDATDATALRLLNPYRRVR